jgi:hypothetical protein
MATTQIFGNLTAATPLDVWLGTCEGCKRGVRATDGAGDHCAIICPVCDARVAGERVYGTVTVQSCDSRCMGALGPACSCGCGGKNHGGAWSQEGQALASAVAAYRSRLGKTAAEAARKASARRAAFDRWADAAPQCDVIPAILANDLENDFLGDLADQLRDRKELTPRQLDAASRTVNTINARKIQRAERDARQAEFEASGKTLTVGKVTFAGEVVSARIEEGNYGTSFKCLILTDDGFRVWGTMPGALITQARNEEIDARRDWDYTRSMRGRRVELTATVTPKAGEPGFGFFSRPRGSLLPAR